MNLNEIMAQEKQEKKLANEQQELSVLMAETRELNDLMRSYIKVEMDKDAMNHQAVLKEIEAIETTSQRAQEQMILILREQKNSSDEQLRRMHDVSEHYLDQMHEQEQLSKRKLEQLNAQIVANTKEGLNQVDQKVEGVLARMDQKMDKTFKKMDKTIKTLKNNIYQKSFEEKAKVAFPIATLSSVITMLMYFLFRLIDAYF